VPVSAAAAVYVGVVRVAVAANVDAVPDSAAVAVYVATSALNVTVSAMLKNESPAAPSAPLP
jgi:hypothetical protein